MPLGITNFQRTATLSRQRSRFSQSELNRRPGLAWLRRAYCVKYAVAWKMDGSNVGDIPGTRNGSLGMVPKLLTDARETSYVILSSLLTAECSTVELPGNRVGRTMILQH